MTRELEVLADLARRSARVDADPRSDAELRRLGQAWRRRGQKRTLAALSVGLVAASAAALLLYVGRVTPAPLTYAVEGDVAWANRHIDVRGGAGARMSFSDGTRFDLASATRAELASVDERGARLRLQGGRARAAVVHKPGARWAVEAGPFTVRVIGTVFDVTWSGDDQVLEVALLEGAVMVEGPSPQLPLSVRAGQRLTLRARDGQLRIAPLAAAALPPPEQPRPVAPAAAGPATALPSAPSAASVRAVPALARPSVGSSSTRVRVERATKRALARMPAIEASAHGSTAPLAAPSIAPSSAVPSPSPSPAAIVPPPAMAVAPPPALLPAPVALPAPPPARPWAARIAAGEFQPVLDEALSEGLDSSYQRRSSADLAGLGDAARYLGRRDIARDALLAQRRRFPGAEHARRAAFHLGALAEEAAAADEAIRWYDIYLADAPSGSYAPEALGRKMLAIERRDGVAAARVLAHEYQRRFAQGPYLVHALRISQAR